MGPHSREKARGNTCRNNMRGVALALSQYELRTGNYPGYMNALELTDKTPYHDPFTGAPTPVSWAVMILPDIDRQTLYNQWLAPTEETRNGQFIQPKIYIEQFLCPTDPQSIKSGTPISFVVNTGLPDAPSAVIDSQDPVKSISRDWAANGMFFDNYSEHPLVRIDEATRGPMVLMTEERVRDLKSRTILLTENIDATNYTFDAATQSADGWRAVEIETGCIWKPGTFAATTGTPMMNPPADSLQINHDVGRGDGKSFDHTRPSSRHPDSVNVAFVEINTTVLSDQISYFVYAKLMTSDDEHVAPAGALRAIATIDAMDPQKQLRKYELTEADINP